MLEARSRFGERKLPTFLQKPYDVDTLLSVVQAEFASVQVGSKLNNFDSLSQSEKDDVIDKQAKAELNQSMMDHEASASQQSAAPNP